MSLNDDAAGSPRHGRGPGGEVVQTVWRDRREALESAMRLHRAGRLADAETIYRRILALEPGDPDALHYLGVLCHQRGGRDEAIALIRRAIARAPAYADAYNNLGNVLQESGRIEEAARVYRRALELRPDDARTHHNLAIALRSLGKLPEAIALHRRAIDLAPSVAEGHLSLGKALRQTGDLDGAIEAFGKAVALEPTHGRACVSLGRALHRAGRYAEAVAVFDQWLMRDSGNPIALHMRAACSGAAAPGRASDGYVRELFDGLARDFDEHLRDLRYRAPELTIEALAAEAGPPRQALDALDAGCGTGLCGPLLRPYARRLVGVDLSESMLARARARAVYDELVPGELTAYLESRPQAFDVILSADTLIYFGDLEPVVAAGARALRDGGRLVFTVERADVGGDGPAAGYRLNPSGRYSHTAAYLDQRLAASGLTVVSVATAVLRHESGSPVEGYVVIATKR